MTTRILSKLLELIKENKSFLIVSHINPEGDAIGSSIALALCLKKINKSVYILNKEPVPDTLRFLPSSDLISQKIPVKTFDVVFVIDCHTLERTGLKSLHAKTAVIIDHHIPSRNVTSSMFHTQQLIRWIDPEASATGELIYKLLNFLHVPLDKKMATNLYTSLYTDTGGFRYRNTTPESLEIASKLVALGADPWEITKEVYECLPFNRLKLLAMSLSTLEKAGKMACVTVTQNMFKNTKTSVQDTENFVDFPRKIKDIEVAVLFREGGKNSYKVSLRSKGKVNVANIAKKFGGGGHAMAAGCTLKGSLLEVKDKVLKVVRKAIKNKKSKCKIQN